MQWIVRLLWFWLANALAILVAVLLVGNVHADSAWAIAIAGAVFGLVNMFVKPILRLLALPLIVITLGVVLFLINMLMLALTAFLVPGFHIDGFGALVRATLVVWLVNLVVELVLTLLLRRPRVTGSAV